MTLEEQFLQHFQRPATISTSSPGRVNLIGEHTDYNDGLVLPTTIPQRCTVLFAPRDDRQARVHSVQMKDTQTYPLGEERAGRDWLDYVQGVTEELRKGGFALQGFDALVSSDVPVGSGLSSSASLMVTVTKGLRALNHLQIDDVAVAKLAQRGENGLVGARVGLMDQMACSLAKDGEALLIDFKTLEFRTVKLPANAELVILHSGLTHSLKSDDGTRNYKTRRRECEHACEVLGISSLRDLTTADLGRINALPAPFAARARHVVTENARVLEAVAAFETDDLERVGQLFYLSHASMRDDYDVSEPEIDLIVDLARETPGIYGARLTGGGFGGSVVMLAVKGQGRAAGERINGAYTQQSGLEGRLMSPLA
jgi:galactokinase